MRSSFSLSGYQTQQHFCVFGNTLAIIHVKVTLGVNRCATDVRGWPLSNVVVIWLH